MVHKQPMSIERSKTLLVEVNAILSWFNSREVPQDVQTICAVLAAASMWRDAGATGKQWAEVARGAWDDTMKLRRAMASNAELKAAVEAETHRG